jgi:hypothetical protein
MWRAQGTADRRVIAACDAFVDAISSQVWQGRGMRERRAHAAGLAVVVLVVGQLAALAHEAAVRHVICDEHGEQIEAPVLLGAVDGSGCEQAHFTGIRGHAGEHADCAIARVLRQSTRTPRSAPAIASTTIATPATYLPQASIVAAIDVVRIAPKTSPPV